MDLTHIIVSIVFFIAGGMTQHQIDKRLLKKKIIKDTKKIEKGMSNLTLAGTGMDVDVEELYCPKCHIVVWTSSGTCWNCGKDLK